MKFSHSIQLNSAPEWRDHYIAYSRLKKITYILEKATLGLGKLPATTNDLEDMIMSPSVQSPNLRPTTDPEAQPLLDNSGVHETLSIDEANKFFCACLDQELEKIKSFYSRKETEILKSLNNMTADITKSERQEETYLHSLWKQESSGNLAISPINTRTPNTRGALDSWDEQPNSSSNNPDEIVEVDSVNIPRPGFLPYLIWSSGSLKHHRQQFLKQAINLFVVFCELKDYVEINETGFSKVLKKYEKVVGTKLKAEYLEKVESEYPFLPTTKAKLTEAIDRLIQWYARIATDGKIGIAQNELKSHLREHIVWERNTIWRDMVESERRRETIGFVSGGLKDQLPSYSVVIHICGCPCYLPSVIPTNIIVLIFSVILLIAITQSTILPLPEQTNCLAILVFASTLWAFEALPLFVTSMLVPFLVIVLRTMTDHGVRLDAKSTAKVIFADMFGPVIMLLLSSFSLAAALSKHNIAKVMAGHILSRAGTKPASVLLANMFVSTFASMWISNVAAPVLCFSLISPILRNLPSRSPYARCLVLGIALAANVGGMASPIASPQNVISMGIMNPPPSWGEWFIIALPICIVLDLLIWGLLLLMYRPTEMNATPAELFSNPMNENKFSYKQYYIIFVSVATIFLWCIQASIEEYVGDMGTVAILPIVAFYGAGILTKDDWNSMLWSVVMLAMGGIALGKTVASSGLLAEITKYLIPVLQEMSVFTCLALLSAIVVVVTCFISHTVGALILLPVIAEIGLLLPDPRPRTLVMAAALMCSGGMGLPVSSFPNMNAISLEDPRGVPWLKVVDFLAVGPIASVAAWALMVTFGYIIMTLIDFQ
ncbi:SPX domain-containing protein, partial [Globomyces pollinis-pini]